MTVPAGVPVRDFWSVEVYDLEIAGWLRGATCTGRDSTRPELVRNRDGSVDLYFGPEAPKGMESNWMPTLDDHRYFLYFRFYGPEPAVYSKSWQLNDPIKLD